MGGAVSTFRRKHWGMALAGAICSVFIVLPLLTHGIAGLIFPAIGILAIVFLIKSKGEFG